MAKSKKGKGKGKVKGKENASLNATQQELLQKHQAFAKEYKERPGVMAKIAKTLDARPEFQHPMGVGNHEKLIEEAKEMNQSLKKSVFKNIDLACWVFMTDESRADLMMRLNTVFHGKTKSMIMSTFENAGPTVKWFFQDKKDQSARDQAVMKKLDMLGIADAGPRLNSTDKARSEKESRKCRERDNNLCLVTKSPLPEACHIVPFACNKNEFNTAITGFYTTKILNMFIPQGEFDELHSNLTSKPGCSDKAWNMICLNPYLHALWAKGLWAFRYIDDKAVVEPVDQQEVRLQFHWTKVAAGENTLKPEGTVDWDEAIQRNQEPGSKVHTVLNHETHRPIETGDIFKVRLPRADAKCFIRMINLQWAMINICAMAGGAGHPELFDDYNDFGYNGEALGLMRLGHEHHDPGQIIAAIWAENAAAPQVREETSTPATSPTRVERSPLVHRPRSSVLGSGDPPVILPPGTLGDRTNIGQQSPERRPRQHRTPRRNDSEKSAKDRRGSTTQSQSPATKSENRSPERQQ